MVTTLEPGGLAEPTTAAGAAALLRAGGAPVVFAGSGTKQSPPAGSPPPATISTRSLAGIVFHDPLDGIAVVRAGTRLASLQAELAPHGQWLAIDPPFADAGATVGGIFSTNDAGPRRLAYGTLRDLVIGATIVTGDGVVARSGGRVIKNVAGFDLARLYCGAFGTLGLVAEVALRLHPLREVSRTATVACPLEKLGEMSQAIRTSGLTPTAVDWHWDARPVADGGAGGAEPGALLVRFEERTARATAAQVSDFVNLCRLSALETTVLDDGDELAAWAAVDGLLAGTPNDLVVRAVTRPSRTAEAVAVLGELAGAGGVEFGVVSHALVGVHTACLRGAGRARLASSWRSAIERLGGHLTVRRAGAAGDGEEVLDRWGQVPQAIALMRRLKGELDPHNRCAPGTFVGAI
jgi:glycolate oxidase FAD binding subunit